MEKTNKSNIGLALLLSLLTALAGGALFGVIYGLGYYVYLLAILEIVWSCAIFLKFKTGKAGTIVCAILWSVFWTIISNFAAVLICEAIFIASEYSLSFSESFFLLTELWKTDVEIQAYLTARLFQSIGMIVLGGIIYGISFAVNLKRNKKLQKIAENKQYEPKETDINNVYTNLFHYTKSIYEVFIQDKNKETFKESLSKLEELYVKQLNEKEKTEIKNKLQKIVEDGKSSKEDKNIAKILLTTIK